MWSLRVSVLTAPSCGSACPTSPPTSRPPGPQPRHALSDAGCDELRLAHTDLGGAVARVRGLVLLVLGPMRRGGHRTDLARRLKVAVSLPKSPLSDSNFIRYLLE